MEQCYSFPTFTPSPESIAIVRLFAYNYPPVKEDSNNLYS